MSALTQTQLHILQHSLGLDEYGRGNAYRNHYVAEPQCDGFDECRALVAMGFMIERAPSELTDGMSCFIVTNEGEDAVRAMSPRPPRLTRAQRRYREWLRISDVCDLSFGEWLRQGYRT